LFWRKLELKWGRGELSERRKEAEDMEGEKGVGTTRKQSGVQTNTHSSHPPQKPKQRQRRALRGLSWRAVLLVLGVAEPASAHTGVQRDQAPTGTGSPTGAAVKQPVLS
jgi:hypothetical protein